MIIKLVTKDITNVIYDYVAEVKNKILSLDNEVYEISVVDDFFDS